MTDVMTVLPEVGPSRWRRLPVERPRRAALGTTRVLRVPAGVGRGVVDLAAAASVSVVAYDVSRLPDGVLVVLLVGWPALLAATRVADPGSLSGRRTSTRQVLRAAAALATVGWAAGALVPLGLGARPALLLLLALALATLALHAAVGASSAVVRRAPAPTRVLVAGTGPEVARSVAALRRTGQRSVQLAGVCVTSDWSALPPDLPSDALVLTDVDDLPAAAEGVDAVLALPSLQVDAPALRRLCWHLEDVGTDLCLGTGLLDASLRRTRVTNAGGSPVVHVRPAGRSGASRLAQDVVERLAATLALLLLAPVFLALAVAIRADSGGSALFRQVRIGRDGRAFTMYKLRTMTVEQPWSGPEGNDSDSEGVLFKLRADPRVTRVGRVLRRYSVDELPQLINVVLGHMSLVGPRPALGTEVAAYEPDMCRRLVVKPGLTGLWQVSGRSDLSWEDTVRLDLQYVDNWSPALDLAIIWRTAGAVLGHRGAY